MATAPLAPVRFSDRPRLVKWLMARFGREWDRYTGSWVRLGWPAERQALTDRHFALRQPILGTCTSCGKPIAEHPPERVWTNDPAMCPR